MLSLIWFVLILGAIVAVHEFGHFIFAKLSNTYVYEFSIGMGKKIFGKKRKNGETEFCLRMIPLGGYVMIAGEDVVDEKISKDRQMCNKGFIPRFLILFAGAFFNFIFAFIILFLCALIWGASSVKPYVHDVIENKPAQVAGIEKGDLILSIDGKEISSWDQLQVVVFVAEDEELTFKVKKANGDIVEYEIKPEIIENEDGEQQKVIGISGSDERKRGFVNSLDYAWNKILAIFASMWDTIVYLFTGKVPLNQLSGPVGIFGAVDSRAKVGTEALMDLVAYLSVNVGMINLLPFPAFDGGRILFLIIEKIFRKPVSKRVENIIHSVGFFLIIALLLYVTFNDVLKLF